MNNITAQFPFESKYIDIKGSKMHYIDESNIDEGDIGKDNDSPILLLHGNPTSSYLWRNVIPHLKPQARCIAPDLIGMGKSDKPDIEYTYEDHYDYLSTFIEKMGLKNITLVIHDWGSGLGFNYAANNPDNVRGIAFMEALTRPFTSWESVGAQEREFIKGIRTPNVGEEIILNQNVFIEQFLPGSVFRGLTPEELDVYRTPFKTIESRLPILRWARQIPIAGEPANVHEIVSNYYQWLQSSSIPKLMIHVSPGAIITDEVADELKQILPNLESVHIGQGHHFIQEDHPHKIGKSIAQWFQTLP